MAYQMLLCVIDAISDANCSGVPRPVAPSTCGMAVINHDLGIIFVGQIANLIQFGLSPSIEKTPSVQIRRYFMSWESSKHLPVPAYWRVCSGTVWLCRAYTINDGSKVKLVRNQSTVFAQEWFKNSAIGVKASGIRMVSSVPRNLDTASSSCLWIS